MKKHVNNMIKLNDIYDGNYINARVNKNASGLHRFKSLNKKIQVKAESKMKTNFAKFSFYLLKKELGLPSQKEIIEKMLNNPETREMIENAIKNKKIIYPNEIHGDYQRTNKNKRVITVDENSKIKKIN